MGTDLPIILLSGMAADERLFESQLAAIPNLRIQSWQAPVKGESLRAYAARLAKSMNPGSPCIIGGASFGGVVALELTRFVPAVACILIGSVRSPPGLPWRWRSMWPIAMFGPNGIRTFAKLLDWFGRPFLRKATLRKLRRLASPQFAFVRWAICAVLQWRPSPTRNRIRVFHIHGSADDVLPVRLSKPDVVVPGGSHALPLFNPMAVNEFLGYVMRKIAEKDSF